MRTCMDTLAHLTSACGVRVYTCECRYMRARSLRVACVCVGVRVHPGVHGICVHTNVAYGVVLVFARVHACVYGDTRPHIQRVCVCVCARMYACVYGYIRTLRQCMSCV